MNLHLEIVVRRDHLLFDLITCLAAAFSSNPRTFRLPLKVTFAGEDAIDHGGEFFLTLIGCCVWVRLSMPYFSSTQEWLKNYLHWLSSGCIRKPVYSIKLPMGAVFGLVATVKRTWTLFDEANSLCSIKSNSCTAVEEELGDRNRLWKS